MLRLGRCLRALILALVVLGMLPGASELMETVEHLLHDGHLPHSAAHELALTEADHGSEEHGCSPLSHHCKCHGSQPATPPDEVALVARSAARDRQPIPTASAGRPTHGVAPPLRPPIA